MFAQYQDIFKIRGHLYHQAMALCPQTRAQEFDNVIRKADVTTEDVVCDIPSGGGYLRHYLEPPASLIHIESSEVFANLCRANGADQVLLGSLEHIPLRTGIVDKIISLAALHHVRDKEGFCSEAFRVLKKGGTVTIADVQSHTNPSEFLDGFVHNHNSIGHQGLYIDRTTSHAIAKKGFRIMESTVIPFHWVFASLETMGRFCQLLFGIDKATPEQIVEGIRKHVGYDIEHDQCRMNWELLCISAKKL